MATNQDLYSGFSRAYRAVLKNADAANLALRFERFCPFGGKENNGEYLELIKDEGKISLGGNDESVSGDTAKFTWLKQFDGETAGSKKHLAQEHARRARLCQAIDGKMFELTLDWRFLTGSGNAHPIENGLTWHPTLGVPYLPGSSFKGLLRAFLQHWQGDAATLEQALFGDTEAAGQLQFFDVLPTGPVSLLVDVMTPHYGEWYVGGGDKDNALKPQCIPAPWHNPVPIPFLVVEAPLTLCAMVAPLGGVDRTSLWDELETLVAEAFSVASAGAKTASGYGRMTLAKGHVACAQAMRENLKKQAQESEQLKIQREEEIQRQRDRASAEQAEQERKAKKAERAAMPKTARSQELLKQVLSKGNGRAIAGYLCGKNFKHDMDEWQVGRDDMKTAFHQDAQMMAHIKQWAGKKGNEGQAYEDFKPPRKP